MSERGEYRAIHTVLMDGPDFQGLSPYAKLVFYTSKLSLGPSGIDVVPAFVAALCERTGLDQPEVAGALDELREGGWLEYERNVVWVVDGLRFEPNLQIGNPKHVKGVRHHIAGLPRLHIVRRFREQYAKWFEGDDGPPIAYPDTPESTDSHSIGYPMPIGSGVRSKEQGVRSKGCAAAPRRKRHARNTPPATLDEAIDDFDHEKPAVAEQREEGASKSVAAVAGRVTWLTPFQEAWDAAYGAGSFAAVAGHAAKVFRPQKDRPRDEIWRAITNYAKATDPQYATPTGCARTWGAWAAEPAEDYLPVNGWLSPEMDRLTRPA